MLKNLILAVEYFWFSFTFYFRSKAYLNFSANMGALV
jgi:hypothetical protein